MRDPRTAGRSRRALGLVVVGVVALLLGACGQAPQTVLEPRGPAAEQPDDLFRLVLVIALVVFLIVQTLIIVAVVKYRDRGDDSPLPAQVHGNTRLEIFWTLIPAVILAVIAVPTIRTVFDLAETPEDALEVQVIGHRWWWEYVYTTPDGEFSTANELVLPVDTPVHLVMTSEEAGGLDNAVIHSFWLPGLGGKQDVVPGRVTDLNYEASETGTYMGACTEYCGLSHANMRNYATVVTAQEYDEWVDLQLSPAPEPAPDTAAARGRELFDQQFDSVMGERACSSCHMINGQGAIVGPNLTHLMSREMFAGSIYDLYERSDADDWDSWTDEVNVTDLAAWLENAPAQKAMRPDFGIGMPDLGLSEDQVDDLVAYLTTLE